MDPASFESSIAVRYWACMSHIYWLLNTLKDPRQHSGLGKSILQKSQIEGIRMKLQVWGDTTRASEWDWDSLGHQLRYSWDIRNQIMEVLVGLGTVLQQLVEMVGKTISTMPHLEHLAKIPNKTPLVNVQELSHDCLRLEAHHYVEGLQRLSPTLEKPMPSTRPKSEPLPLVPVKEYSRASVQRLFPLASQAVKDQLCLAIAARRQIVTLRQSAEQLSRYSKSLSESASVELSILTHSSAPSSSRHSPVLVDTSEHAEPNLLLLQYETFKSFISHYRQNLSRGFCPFCYSRDSYKGDDIYVLKHVLQDLRMYVCTHEECRDPAQFYDTISDWLYHEIATHRSEWFCRVCDTVYYHRYEMECHLRKKHSEIIDDSGEMLDFLLARCYRSRVGPQACHFCTENIPLEGLEAHTSFHIDEFMIDISLELLMEPVESDIGLEEFVSNASHHGVGEIKVPTDTYVQGDSLLPTTPNLGSTYGEEPRTERTPAGTDQTRKICTLNTTDYQCPIYSLPSFHHSVDNLRYPDSGRQQQPLALHEFRESQNRIDYMCMFYCPHRYSEKQSWIQHVLTHLEGCPLPQPEVYRTRFKCGRCRTSFYNLTWADIVSHLFTHVQGKDGPRRCLFLSSDLQCYLLKVQRLPVPDPADQDSSIEWGTDTLSQRTSHASVPSLPGLLPSFEGGRLEQGIFEAHTYSTGRDYPYSLTPRPPSRGNRYPYNKEEEKN